MAAINWKELYEAWDAVALHYIGFTDPMPMREDVVCHATSQMFVNAMKYIANEVAYIDESAVGATSMLNHVGKFIESKHLDDLASYCIYIDSWREHDLEYMYGDLKAHYYAAVRAHDIINHLVSEFNWNKKKSTSNGTSSLLKMAEGNPKYGKEEV